MDKAPKTPPNGGLTFASERAREAAVRFLYTQGHGLEQIAKVSGLDLDKVAVLTRDLARRPERRGA